MCGDRFPCRRATYSSSAPTDSTAWSSKTRSVGGRRGVAKEDEIGGGAGSPPRGAADELMRGAIGGGAPETARVIVAGVRPPSDVGDNTLADGEPRLDETQRSTAKIAAYDEKVM